MIKLKNQIILVILFNLNFGGVRFMAATAHRIDSSKLLFLNNEALISIARKNKSLVKYPKEVDSYLEIAFVNSTRCLGVIHNLHISLSALPILVCNVTRSSDLFADKSNNSFIDALDSNPIMLKQFIEGVNCGFRLLIKLPTLQKCGIDNLFKIKSYLVSMSARRYLEFVGH
jgi:hypothetical protein